MEWEDEALTSCNMAKKQISQNSSMWKSENQALTSYNHKHGTEVE